MWEERRTFARHAVTYRKWGSWELAVDGEPQRQVSVGEQGCDCGDIKSDRGQKDVMLLCVTFDFLCAGKETISVEDPWLTPDG